MGLGAENIAVGSIHQLKPEAASDLSGSPHRTIERQAVVAQDALNSRVVLLGNRYSPAKMQMDTAGIQLQGASCGDSGVRFDSRPIRLFRWVVKNCGSQGRPKQRWRVKPRLTSWVQRDPSVRH